MTKRLQVLFQDALRACIRAATANPSPQPKLRAACEAMAYAYPVADIKDINAEIERGYLGTESSVLDEV